MKKIKYLIIEIILIILIITAGINVYMVKKTENNIVKINDLSDNYDAILVLGCKVDSNGPSMMLENRLNKSIEVYNKLNTKLLISGDHGQNEYDEVNVMKDYLINKNIDESDIFQDHAGFSTYDSIYRAKNVFNAEKIVIITQKYHMFRALYLADKLGLNAVGVVADDVPYRSVMIKNELREIIKPESKYIGDTISLEEDGNITNG